MRTSCNGWGWGLLSTGSLKFRELKVAGSFSFRKWGCTTTLKGVKSFVPRGALLARHAPHEPKPLCEVNKYDSTAPATHRGVCRNSGLPPLSRETSSFAGHPLLGVLCNVVWVSNV